MFSRLRDHASFQIGVIFLIVLTGVVTTFFQPSHDPIYLEDFHAPFVRLVIGWFSYNGLFIAIFSYLLLLINGFYMEVINRKYVLINFNTRLPFLLYILIVIALVPVVRVWPALLFTFFILMAIDKLFSSFGRQGIAYELFDMAFILSLGSLIYINGIYFLGFAIIGTAIMRSFKPKEWVLMFIGFALPQLFYLFSGLLFDFTIWPLFNIQAYPVITEFHFGLQILFFLWILILVIISSIQMSKEIQKKKVSARRYLILFFSMFIFVLVLIPTQLFSVDIYLFLALPVSYVLAHYFLHQIRGRWSLLLLRLTVVFFIVVQVFLILGLNF